MSELITAVYQNGTLVLEEPLSLSNGSKVDVVVVPKVQTHGSAVAKRMASIAALPAEGKANSFSGRDHDQILYGKADRK
jgi:predicted DNA-binding antitoxin AbrB/MazE fold protein